MIPLSVILSVTKTGHIGLEWDEQSKPQCELVHSPVDKDHFSTVTKYSPSGHPNVLIVGRKTWETLPPIMRNCKRRRYVVLTSQPNYHAIDANDAKNVKPQVCNSWSDALTSCQKIDHHKVFVIGGAQIYSLAMNSGWVMEVFLTRFNWDLNTLNVDDPNLQRIEYEPPLSMFKIDSSRDYPNETISITSPLQKTKFSINEGFTIYHYVRKCHPFELQYMRLLDNIHNHGIDLPVRNGIARSSKNHTISIDLADGFPICTLRKTFWRGIKEELLWMMSGCTDVSVLSQKYVHIWDANATRDFLDAKGLMHLVENDIGPGYGFQFRYSGAKYIDCKTDYTGQGVDQLVQCVNLIKTDPTSRRIIVNLWSVPDINAMALPPCHYNYQFTIEKGKLSCHMYQRSWDVLLGWNTSTAALLTHLLAHFCDLDVGYLTHTVCDAHMYANDVSHMEAYRTMQMRRPYTLPKLKIEGNKPDTIDSYSADQLVLENYQFHDAIKITFYA